MYMEQQAAQGCEPWKKTNNIKLFKVIFYALSVSIN